MSGICGLARVDGAPIDAAMLERMTTCMAFRGPDARATWAGASAGMGHTLLRMNETARAEAQPRALGDAWIVADARLDGRAGLVSRLASAGRAVRDDAGDAELLLHAYAAWGESCVDHLLGDFAFAVWDGAARRLFCARDPLGVKPFFYACMGPELAFANTLGTVRTHPGVGDGLDEAWIADFLLFEMSQEPSATAFAAVRRLPPAHCLTFGAEGMRIRRYWQLEASTIARYTDDRDYIERFDELLQAAVSDRTGDRRVSVLMSGGLDSPALASLASRSGADVRAFTSVYDHLFADDERQYSILAAAALRIPIAHRPGDGYALFERYARMPRYFCEPANAPFAALDVDLTADAAAHSRVVLTGWDADTLLAESPRPYLRELARRRQWMRLAGALMRYAIDHPSHAARSIALRMGGRPIAPQPESPSFPAWLRDSFAKRLRLRERWNEAHLARPRAADPLRPNAHGVFAFLQRMSSFFEAGDPGRTGIAAELRHPFMDLRLVDFCLSLPTIPWCVRKEILRRWLRGRVPASVRLRPKTPLAGFPHMEVLRQPGSEWLDRVTLCAEAAEFIDQGKMTSIRGTTEPATAWADLRPASLDLWFRHARAAT